MYQLIMYYASDVNVCTRKCTVDSVFLERLTAVLVEAVDLVERADELVSRRQQREGHAAAQLPRGRAAAARQAPRVALALRAVAAAALRTATAG